MQMFPAVKSFFLSQEHLPTVIWKLFENEMSVIYLWHTNSLMAVFRIHIQSIEKENTSAVECYKFGVSL